MTKRPNARDEDIRLKAATEMAPKVVEWLQAEGDSDSDVESVAIDLASVVDYREDGYEIAKALDDRFGYSPNASLVDVLDCFGFVVRKHLVEAEKKWVLGNGLKGQEIGSMVIHTGRALINKRNHSLGIVCNNEETGKSTVAMQDHWLSAAKGGRSGYVLPWEDLKPWSLAEELNRPELSSLACIQSARECVKTEDVEAILFPVIEEIRLLAPFLADYLQYMQIKKSLSVKV
jgi:hypothetical protein